MKKYTQILSDYLCGLRYEQIPPEVIERAKILSLHTLGVAISAHKCQRAQEIIAVAKAMGGSAPLQATIFGDGGKVGLSNAALANGTMADLLDWEDCSWTGHPSAGNVSVGLSAAECYHRSGKEYLTALVGSYDVYHRIAMAVQPSVERWKKGWGLFAWQIFAPATVYGKLLRLDPVKMNQLLGATAVCTPCATGHVSQSFTDFYHHTHGLTAKTAVECGLIVEKGISTLMNALEDYGGFYVGVSDQCDWDWLDRDLGKHFSIMDTLIKHWPVNMWVQSPMDMLDELVTAHGIQADQIQRIEVSPNLWGRSEPAPKEGYDSIVRAQFSIPFCAAMYLKGPKPGWEWTEAKYLTDPTILEMASRVYSLGEQHHPREGFWEFKKGGYLDYYMKITLKDGTVYEKSLTYPVGHPKNPYTRQESIRVFRLATKDVLSPEKTEALIDLFLNRMEETEDLSILGELVTA